MGERLILWDIDMTLVDVETVGGAVFSAAFTAFSGLSDYVPSRGPGRTEWQWFLDTLEVNGLAHLADEFPRFLSLQDAEFRRRATELRTRGRVLPGAREVLRHCAASSDVLSSLLTGNAVGNARRKLRAFDLEHLVETRMGGYGDDHWDRSELVGVARRRVRETTGLEFTPDTTVLVGDTPNDVRAAREGGARVVAVATGHCGADVLRAAGAATVLDDLSDTGAVMEALLA